MEQSRVSLINSPPKKNPKGKYVHSGQKEMIINIYKQKIKEQPEIKYKQLMKVISDACGIGQRTICTTLSEYKKTGTVSSPNRKRDKPSVIQKLSETEKNKIRQIMDEFCLRREQPTLAKILTAVNEDPDLRQRSLSRSNLYRVIKGMKLDYTHQERNNRKVVIDVKVQKTKR